MIKFLTQNQNNQTLREAGWMQHKHHFNLKVPIIKVESKKYTQMTTKIILALTKIKKKLK